ncbi:hypothetical protein RI138_32035 [Streptomyces sp. C11-1]|uniref:Thymidylate kinase-like domain-containing protein n=1 Tax=Streptomyces durocortorensis TaxID=2811104 RepID=A0ABY9W4J6_9ACTN|nr:hypothetical protein [Streptomyces durocortorensis]WNF31085.1 hypothetical protein RI138_32035 [Streptomyces durocortorensis]
MQPLRPERSLRSRRVDASSAREGTVHLYFSDRGSRSSAARPRGPGPGRGSTGSWLGHLALAAVSGTANAGWLRRLYGQLPAPDVAFLLDLSPEVAAARVRARNTDTNSLSFLTRFRDAYRDLDEYRDGVFTVLDAGLPPAGLLDDAWAHLARTDRWLADV